MSKYLPIAPKKSFPRKGKPGRLASTTILKSLCALMAFSGNGIVFPDGKTTIVSPVLVQARRMVCYTKSSCFNCLYKKTILKLIKTLKLQASQRDITEDASISLSLPPSPPSSLPRPLPSHSSFPPLEKPESSKYTLIGR